ncbi:PEP-CTERM sorting domain-containing protein [Dendronalium sp. ChiSLP03b]|uniref:PEP-CTERM sorting domain-containing protein n=1 Tax=Dendronalium sp. ChiSLP03b TaxID=3075381 RepID=UPI002AD37999|nr:PEP-CTERM sorting domain-containing protein [Dendronalium sp. ChiSLP03b]MDZ8209091.1 PEP-CTERM sorting domain-containing protein [Dendronalium sp. ChiSLP03b]
MTISIVWKKLSIATGKAAYFLKGIGCVSATGTVLVAFSTLTAQAAVISNGELSVEIRNDNGAINSLLFGRKEFYRKGTFVSDFGFQVGSDTSTFVLNSALKNIGQPVTVSKNNNSVSVTGRYTQGGSAIDFTRTYSLVPNHNVLRITTNFINSGADTLLSYFDTFDPDQGIAQRNGYGTYNDVFSIATGNGIAKVGQATDISKLSVVIASLDPDVTVASGFPFKIGDGKTLNNFFNSPFDGNGSYVDNGTHIGLRKLLTAGNSFSFTFDQGFGNTSIKAQQEFLAVNGGGTPVGGEVGGKPVPEPLTIFGSVTAVGFGIMFRKMRLKKFRKSLTQGKNS